MAIEKERKFLLKDNKLPEGLGVPTYIQQGYLMKGQNDHLRVRLVAGFTGIVAYKHDISETERHEFEFSTSKADALQLLDLCPHKLDKLRYNTKFGKNRVDIDVYSTFNGKVMDSLAVVEIEYDGELKELPDYCGEEVTGQTRYSNINLAINGYTREEELVA